MRSSVNGTDRNDDRTKDCAKRDKRGVVNFDCHLQKITLTYTTAEAYEHPCPMNLRMENIGKSPRIFSHEEGQHQAPEGHPAPASAAHQEVPRPVRGRDPSAKVLLLRGRHRLLRQQPPDRAREHEEVRAGVPAQLRGDGGVQLLDLGQGEAGGAVLPEDQEGEREGQPHQLRLGFEEVQGVSPWAGRDQGGRRADCWRERFVRFSFPE